MLSTGSNAIVAKKMGEGRPDSARETFTTIILLNIIIGLVFAVLGNLAAVPLSRMLGASDLLLKDCVTYLRWQLKVLHPLPHCPTSVTASDCHLFSHCSRMTQRIHYPKAP